MSASITTAPLKFLVPLVVLAASECVVVWSWFMVFSKKAIEIVMNLVETIRLNTGGMSSLNMCRLRLVSPGLRGFTAPRPQTPYGHSTAMHLGWCVQNAGRFLCRAQDYLEAAAGVVPLRARNASSTAISFFCAEMISLAILSI